jgi:hypothetical protein
MGAARMPAIVVASVLLAGCGGSGKPVSPTEREWADNAAGFIDGLADSLELSANGGSDLASARHALHDESDLYVILVAYTRFGGCVQTLANVGVPTERVRDVERTLRLACTRLERSAALFTRAIRDSDPRALVAANRVALRAAPLLSQAKSELAEVRPPPG